MGWTESREVQCGCGWTGCSYELFELQYFSEKPMRRLSGSLIVVRIPSQVIHICPCCRADLNYQYYKVQFRVKEMPMRAPLDGWFKTTKLL